MEPNGPYDYSWSGPAGYTNNVTGVAGASTINGLAAGNYTVTITDASLCAVTATVTVADNSVAPGPPTTAPVTYCLNDIAVPLTATASAGGTLNWYGTDAVEELLQQQHQHHLQPLQLQQHIMYLKQLVVVKDHELQ